MAQSNDALIQRLNNLKIVPSSFESDIKDWYRANTKTIISLAGSEKAAASVITGTLYAVAKNPTIRNCDIKSIGEAVMTAAQLGLTPGAMQECALVPYGKECKFVPMYQGLIKLARNSGQVFDIECDVVYSNDKFDYKKGTNKYVEFIPYEGPDEQRGERRLVYAVIELTKGRQIEVKNMEWVETRRKMSKAKRDDSPWVLWYDEMCRKTILKYALKFVPKSAELQLALDHDDAIERGVEPVSPARIGGIAQGVLGNETEGKQGAANSDGDNEASGASRPSADSEVQKETV